MKRGVSRHANPVILLCKHRIYSLSCATHYSPGQIKIPIKLNFSGCKYPQTPNKIGRKNVFGTANSNKPSTQTLISTSLTNNSTIMYLIVAPATGEWRVLRIKDGLLIDSLEHKCCKLHFTSFLRTAKENFCLHYIRINPFRAYMVDFKEHIIFWKQVVQSRV